MAKVSEKRLDAALDEALRSDPRFATWFVDRTKFAGMGATYLWSRSDHPWGRVEHITQDSATGESVTSMKEGETDVLAVFVTQAGLRFALHIENKLSGGHFMRFQPELYAVRARQWMGNPKYQSYTDFETVLVAPNVFHRRNVIACQVFDRYISHEDIAPFIPLFL
jgi:hypothetical protein